MLLICFDTRYMKSDDIALVTIGGNNYFWTGSLEALQEQHPLQQQPHRLACYLLLCTDATGDRLMVDNETITITQPGVICIKPNSVCNMHLRSGSVVCFTEDFFSLRYNSNVLYQFSFLAK